MKIERSTKTLVTFDILMVVSFIVLWIGVYPYISNFYWYLSSFITFIFSALFFLFCWLLNPGYLEKAPNVDFLNLVDKLDPTTLCPKCEVIQTVNSRHCYICDKCVERFDHHCPWINNCVGIKNHSFFLLFIVFMTAFLVLTFLMCVNNF